MSGKRSGSKDMPKYCANLTWLFTELPLLERFAAAKEAEFSAVELLSPYDVNAQDIVNLLSRYDLEMALINCPPPNYAGGQPGWAAVPGLEERFKRDFRRSARYARTLNAAHLHVLAGEAEGPEARAVFVENLRWAAAEVPKQSLTIEPLNPVDRPGYFLNDFMLASDIIAEVDAQNVRLQFDAYHAAQIHGDVLALWEKMQDITVHVQVAQLPNRTEPDQGVIDYPAFFAALDASGYEGWVSGEYRPKDVTEAGLGWMA